MTFPGGSQISVDYDAYLRSKRIKGDDPAGNPFLDVIYTLDPLDNIEVRETLAARYEYEYDQVNRLTDIETTPLNVNENNYQSYSYDAVGNRLTDSQQHNGSANPEVWIYDDADRLLQRGDITYTYDANGSRITESNAATGDSKTYIYDIENRLSEVKDESSTQVATYRYDPFGRRIRKTTDASTTVYLYSDEGLVAEADENGNVTITYAYQVNTPWGTDPMFIKQGSQYGYYITDHLGTPQIIVSNSGSILWRADYEAFGEATLITQALENNFRFPGQYYDSETGLHYNFLRHYDPQIGRYLTSDPLGIFGGLNPENIPRKGAPKKPRSPFSCGV